MSLTATYPDHISRPSLENRLLLGIIWAAIILSYLVSGLGTGPDYSTDDAMRLAQIRDLLAGQGWFDTVQYRLSPPDGVPMHWSRLIDLPIAALVRVGEALALPTPRAEQAAAFIWPAGLLLAFLAGVARLARALGGDAAARLALIFAALMAMLLQHFRPYALDHHNAQLVLLLWALVLSFAQTKRGPAAAGLCCALSLAIGQELAPGLPPSRPSSACAGSCREPRSGRRPPPSRSCSPQQQWCCSWRRWRPQPTQRHPATRCRSSRSRAR